MQFAMFYSQTDGTTTNSRLTKSATTDQPIAVRLQKGKPEPDMWPVKISERMQKKIKMTIKMLTNDGMFKGFTYFFPILAHTTPNFT